VLTLCSVFGCFEVASRGGRCPEHARDKERQRKTSSQRGYGGKHQAERAEWQARLDAGEVILCWRCAEPIPRDPAEWDLGHDDDDRNIIRGPEHARRCNRAAAGRHAHRKDN